MKRKAKLGRRGFTLIAVLGALAVLGVIASFFGKRLLFEIRGRQKMEAKTSVIDNETALAEMIAGKLKTLFSTSGACGFTKTDFKNQFNSDPPIFPAPAIPIKIESDLAEPTLSKFYDLTSSATTSPELEFKNAVSGCADPANGISVPSNNTPGVYLFCIALDMTGRAPQRSRGFVYSEAAMAQIRVNLVYKSLNQKEKTFGMNSGQAAPECENWDTKAPSEKQMQISYRIFWKSPVDGTGSGYFLYMGSKTINFSELRVF